MKIPNNKRFLAYTLAPILAASMAGGVVLAQTQSASSSTTTTIAADPAQKWNRKEKNSVHIKEQNKALAQILGISESDVETSLSSGKTFDDLIASSGLTKAQALAKMKVAMDEEMKSRLAQDVAAGTITQAQATEMLQKMVAREQAEKEATAKALGISVAELESLQNAGKTLEEIITEKGLSKETVFKALALNRPEKEGHGMKNLQALANILGTTESDIQASLASGKTIDTLISEKGLSKEAVMTEIRAAHEAEMKSRIAQDVAAGTITQAQATEMLQNIENHTMIRQQKTNTSGISNN